jgi:aminomethyltransferase
MNPAEPIAVHPKKTALNATHRALKAKMVDFGGWDMPVEYPGGLVAEHMAVRTGVGLFDVSHMGEIRFRGPGALAAIQHMTMNDAQRLKDGQAHYSALLTPEGTFVDDILVHRISENEYLLVVNAGTKEKDYAWIRWQEKSLLSGPPFQISDDSASYSQLAVQGPRALETLQKLTAVDLAAIKNYWFTFGEVCGVPNVLIARTGYSGEDGFEVYLPADVQTTEKVWNALMEAGAEFGICPCGLGARNTLRLEAGMPLYGHEISDSINPFESGHERWLKLDKGEFIGRETLLAIQAAGGAKRKLVALEMVERGIARDGYSVLSLSGEKIGTITSGSPAPFLKTNIAFALVPADVAAAGVDVLVQVRANRVRAKQVSAPFYKRAKK